MENVDQWARNTAITAQNAAFVLSAALPMLLKRAEAVAPLTEEEVSLLHQGPPFSMIMRIAVWSRLGRSMRCWHPISGGLIRTADSSQRCVEAGGGLGGARARHAAASSAGAMAASRARSSSVMEAFPSCSTSCRHGCQNFAGIDSRMDQARAVTLLIGQPASLSFSASLCGPPKASMRSL